MFSKDSPFAYLNKRLGMSFKWDQRVVYSTCTGGYLVPHGESWLSSLPGQLESLKGWSEVVVFELGQTDDVPAQIPVALYKPRYDPWASIEVSLASSLIKYVVKPEQL